MTWALGTNDTLKNENIPGCAALVGLFSHPAVKKYAMRAIQVSMLEDIERELAEPCLQADILETDATGHFDPEERLLAATPVPASAAAPATPAATHFTPDITTPRNDTRWYIYL